MNIWMINHYAGLPKSVPATRSYDIAKHLARAGHSVTLVACSFNHYTLVEEQLRGSQLVRAEVVEGLRILWVRGPSYQRNGARRLLNMLVFSVLAFAAGVRTRAKPDLIIGTTVHPFAPLSAYLLSRARHARFWVDITDIWPHSLVDLGHIKPASLVARVFAACENFSLRRAELVMSVLPKINEYVRDQGLCKPTLWTPNGFDLSRLPPVSSEFQTNDVFTVMYAGGFAPAHALHVIVEAARLLQARPETPVRFVLIGDGPDMPAIRTRIENYGLTNVELAGFVPKQELHGRLASADALVVTGRNLAVYKYGISYNKIPDYMLAARPIIFALNSSNDPVTDAEAGISIEAENPSALAAAVLRLSRMPTDERRRMGERGRRFAQDNFDYAATAQKMASRF